MLKNYVEKLNEIRQSITDITDGLVKANELIVIALDSCDDKHFNDAKSYIKNIGNKTNSIDNEIVKTLALHSPEARDLRVMVSYFKITNELLRASTNTRTFIKGFSDICKEVDMNTIKEYAIPMQKATVQALKSTSNMINTDCRDEIQEYFNNVLISENKADDLYDMVEEDILKQAKDGNSFEKYHSMLHALRKSAKISDRAMSIASLLLYAKNGGEIHQV
ncbi:MAG TPA: PhoU family transcriptional regulator [Arcobacter sp.]|nr:PhoU family transcriptional regulator [Arcobacter sp.]HIP56354.1 PhoU family transcriptional regulator [Arcobacter sp.]